MAKKIVKNPHLQFAVFGILLATVPTLASLGVIRVGTITTIAGVIIYAMVALGLNLLLGFSGSISLGSAGFMGLGAYIAAFFLVELGMPLLVGLLAAILIPTALGLLVGLVSLRISGLYLAIATLCVSEILLRTFEQGGRFTGGMGGMGPFGFPAFFGFRFGRDTMFVALVVVLVLLMMLTYNLVNGHLGRAFNAMRGSESAAQAMGVNLLKYRLIAFCLANAYAGVAGAMYAYFIRFVFPTAWTLDFSLFILAAVVVGGFRSIYGTVLGAFMIWAVPVLFLQRLPIIGDIPGLHMIFNGILIVLVIMFYPQGLIHIFSDAKRFLVRLAKGGRNSA